MSGPKLKKSTSSRWTQVQNGHNDLQSQRISLERNNDSCFKIIVDMSQWNRTFNATARVAPLVVLVILLLTSVQIDSRLIEIYHKISNQEPNVSPNLVDERPQNLGTPNFLQAANSTIDARSILAQALMSGAQSSVTQEGNSNENDNKEGPSRQSYEFRSPMKRIMDLIGHHHHQPVIVVAADSSSTGAGGESNNLQAQAAGQSADGASTVASATGHKQANSNQVVDQQQQQQQQHWTIIDTSQLGLMPALSAAAQQAPQQQQQQQQPQQLITQQQQLIHSTVPGAGDNQQQYYTFAPSGQLTESMMNQLALQLQPAGGGGPSYGFPTQLMSAAFNPYQQQQPTQVTQSSQNNQMTQSVDQQIAQPVFLSSYVPELPTLQPNLPQFAIGPSGPTEAQTNNNAGRAQQSQQPNSIQSQIQAPSEGEQSRGPDGHSDDSEANDESGDGSDKATEDADDRRHRVNQSDQREGANDEEPADGVQTPASGSISYEDKYDSDNDGYSPHQQSSKRSAKFRAEPSDQVINGLVNVGLNDDCLQCICRAASGCDHLLRCITRGAQEKYCGPFQLTEEFWQKAGSPGDQANNFISFEDCANDADCAVETVTNYMKKYYRDCDGDENITCMDYARLHRLKPNECDQTDKLMNDYDAYWAKFQRCAEGYNRTRNGDDEDI